MFEVIIPGGAPQGTTTTTASAKPDQSAAANAGTVSMEDALKGADHAKMNTFSVSDISKGAGGPNGGPGMAAGGPAGSSVALGGMIQGKVAIDLMDALIPAVLVLLFHRFGISVRKSQMQLTQGEKNTLEPIVSACLNSINLDFSNPWTALCVTLLVIYGGKALEVGGAGWLDKKTNETKPFEQPKPAAPVVPMNVAKGPEPIIEKPNTNNMSFSSPGPVTWTQADVKAVVDKKKCSYAKAEEWLNKNWAKKGGVI